MFSHPAYGQYIATGSGLGTITFSMATDRTVQDVAADGRVMTSDVEGENGSIAIAIQQTSAFHKWLQGLYNYLKGNPAQWNQLTITADSAVMGDNNQCTGVRLSEEGRSAVPGPGAIGHLDDTRGKYV